MLAFILNTERVYLLAHADEHLSDEAYSDFQALLGRRAAGEPLAYITGKKWFFDLEFRVTAAVLIPRPETELLLEEALRLMANRPLGSGYRHGQRRAGGVLRKAPRSRVYASDGSIDALCIARENAQMHAVNVRFLAGRPAHPLRKLDLLWPTCLYSLRPIWTAAAMSRGKRLMADRNCIASANC